MTITIEFTTDNAAFGDDADERTQEIARILRGVAKKIADDGIDHTTGFSLRDINGNTVGRFDVQD